VAAPTLARAAAGHSHSKKKAVKGGRRLTLGRRETYPKIAVAPPPKRRRAACRWGAA
jgi:hypothetical protein